MIKRLLISLLVFSRLNADPSCEQECLNTGVQVTPDKVGVRTQVFFDYVRNRPEITEIYYPVEPGVSAEFEPSLWAGAKVARDAPIARHVERLPLILVSHGFGSSRLDLSWLTEALAANGYIVAAVDHYGNTWYLSLPEGSVRFWERPLDISFVLHNLLKDPFFGPAIDSGKVGFVGHSLGGLTGVWLAGGVANQYPPPEVHVAPEDAEPARRSYLEPLIRAEVLFAPALAQSFNTETLNEIPVPVSIYVGEGDRVTPLGSNAGYLANNIPGATLHVLPGPVGHFIFINEPNSTGRKDIPTQFITDASGVDRAAVHKQIAAEVVCFFNCALLNRATPPAIVK